MIDKKIEFNPYALLYTENVDIYDVYFIIIGDETIEVCDMNGFGIANIHYKECEEVGYIKYNKRERITDDDITIVKNGELVI